MSAAPDEMFAPLGAEAAAPAPAAAREADAWVPILPAARAILDRLPANA